MLHLITHAMFLCLNTACAKPTAKSDNAHAAATPGYHPPTATEIFNLRSRCADLADKIRDDNIMAAPSFKRQCHITTRKPVGVMSNWMCTWQTSPNMRTTTPVTSSMD